MPKRLTKKEQAERIKWLEVWVDKIPNRIQSWLETLDEGTQEKLDYSPESLLVIDKYLSSLDSKILQHYAKDHKDLLHSIASYIGENLRKNLPHEMKWGIRLDEYLKIINDNMTDTIYVLDDEPFLINKTLADLSIQNNFGFNIYSRIYSLIKNKTCKGFYESYQGYYEGSLEQLKELNELIKKPHKKMLGRGGYSYQYYLLLKTSENFLIVIAKQLENHLKTRKDNTEISFHDDNHLLVKMDKDKDYYFHFWFDNSDDTQSEIKEIAQNYDGVKDKNLLSSCQSRIEFWGDEDQDMNFFNDSLFLLEQLENSPEIVAIIDVKTGEELE